MSLELSLLKSFVAVVDHGNFLLASKAVARSPSALTVQIKRLEEQIGKALFVRDARNTKLTKDGQMLLPYARRMISLEAGILAEFNEETIQGTVKLGVPDDVAEHYPMETLRNFNDEHPGVTLTIVVDNTPSLLKAVKTKKLDLTVITYAESIEGISETEKIMSEPEVWAASANGIAWEKCPIPIALWQEGWAWYKPALKILEDADLKYNIILECENISARRAAIKADLAVGPLPISHLDDEVVLAPNLQGLPKLPNYGLGLKVSDTPSDAAIAVASHIRNYFKSRKQWP